MECLIGGKIMDYNIKFQKLSITTGSEGPAHDPYAYTIYTLHNDLTKIELKKGLLTSLKVDGIEINEDKIHVTLEEAFTLLTGLTIKQFMKTYSRIHNPKHCPKCGSTKRKWFSGYPGEEFMVCGNCEQIIDVTFNIGAVI